MAELTYAQVSQLLKYEPETGKLFWLPRTAELYVDGKGMHSAAAKASRWNGRYSGKEAFTADHGQGYKVGSIFNVAYLAHRICWLLFYKAWPEDQIDHDNGIRDDNRIGNLFEASNMKNGKNAKRRSDNSSGVIGVSEITQTGYWQAYISRNGKRFNLGTFPTKAEAISVRKAAEVEAGYNPNHGREAKAYPY